MIMQMGTADEERKMTRMRARHLRDALADETRILLSDQIRKHVLEWPAFCGARSVMAYVSIGSEVNTATLLEIILSTGKRLFLPRCAAHGIMEAVEVVDLSQLVPGRFRIPKPDASLSATSKNDLDIIFVPGLLFDCTGARLGQGGGYYDRFLYDYRGIACGLSYSIQIVEKLAQQAHDVSVHTLATEHGIIRCGEVNQ